MQADFFRLGGTPPRMLELLQGMHASDPEGWLPRRLILQNYWLFNEPEVFHFARGNLMLTGQNESGKSTVLVTAITLVLDMVLTPDRVDTMGSSDRSVRYYLIGRDDAQEDSPNYQRERTAYIALEFERGSSGVFQTIGIGLRSSRDWTNQKVERWGFVMDGSHRVEIDFHLHDGKEARRPLRPGELRERLGRTGQVFQEQHAYKEAVNRALFGFRTVEEYERFLEMLHVVRTPKLGEGLNPKKVEGYLKESLPPIQSEAIDGASEVFSSLDTIEEELERLRARLATVAALEGPQDAAVEAAAQQGGALYRDRAREFRSRKKAHEKLLSDLDDARSEAARASDKRVLLSSDRAEVQGEVNGLRERYTASEAFDFERRATHVRTERDDAVKALDALRADRRGAQRAMQGEQESIAAAERTWVRQRGRLCEKLAALASAARRAFWPSLEQRAGLSRDALEGLQVEGDAAIAGELARSSVAGDAEQRREFLKAVLTALDAVAAAGSRLDAARKASDVARKEYSNADDRFRAAAREADSARGATAAALAEWRARCAELHVAGPEFDSVLARLDSYEPQGRSPAALLAPLQPVHDETRDALRAHALELNLARRRRQEEIEEMEGRLRRLTSEPDLEPDRSPGQVAARRLLREHGIPHTPLYAACDLAGPLAEDGSLAARVEAALLDAGLLDALVVPECEAGRVRVLLEAHSLGDRWIAPSAGEETGAGADWLVPVPSAEVSAGDVMAALRALELGAGGVVDDGGGWRLGPLRGLSPAAWEARVRFLGDTARREERRRQIEEARGRLAELREALGTIEAEILSNQARERLLASEWRAALELPQLQQLHDRLLVVRREEQEREHRRDVAEMAMEAVEAATREVQQRTSALDLATDDAPYLKGRTRADVDAVAAALAEVLSGMRAIGDDLELLDELRRTHRARIRTLESLRVQAEELAPRVAQADARVRMLDALLAALEEQLAQANVGREELAGRISELEERLRAIDAEDREAESAIVRAGTIVATLSTQEPDLAHQLLRAENQMREAGVLFHSRLDSYPTLEEFATVAREASLDQAMQLILANVDTATLDDAVKRTHDELQSAFIRASGTFEELSPTLDGNIIRFTDETGEMRLDDLYRLLEDQRVRNENLLEEEDRRLIEQLMLRDVVDAIRDAIRNTRQWVDDINGILGRMDLFKGGIMRLHWEVRPRDPADAFDPRRLDDLLSQRGIALDEARRDELLDIFRTMVSDIRRKNREKELLEDYRTALLRMIDYTQWYTLTVQRRDENGRWVSLTRRRHNQGSGGRRTLDLLLPLIAAVSARLASADHAAPRLVGFDEAFAGVDDRNAAEIYGLLSELGFCWIMATEKATALGSAVRGSATYEMLTDGVNVAPTLSLWDGERRYDFIGDELLSVAASPREAENGA